MMALAYSITYPLQEPMDAIAIADGGPAVVSIFDNPGEYIGKKIGLSSERLNGDQYAAILSKATGKTTKFSYVPLDVYAKFPFPGAADLAVMFECYEKYGLDRNIELTNKLNPNTIGFEQWAKQNKERIPL